MKRGRPKLNRKNCRDCNKKLDSNSPVYCKKCGNQKSYKWRKANPKRYKELRKNWFLKKFGTTNLRKIPKYADFKRKSDKKYQANKRANLEGYKTEEYRKYREEYPEKVRAQQLLNQAIKKRKITRSPCVDCGRKTNIHGHHPDYSKPLEVIWVCPIHHKNYH